MEKLHVYDHYVPHEMVHICGTKEALQALHQHIEEVLANIAVGGNTRRIEHTYTTNDGEGYVLAMVSVTDKEFEELIPPYTCEHYRSCPQDALKPWRIK